MEAGYFEHDADIGIIGGGPTVEEAFVSAAHAMFAIQAGLDAVQSRERIELDFEEDDAELALVRWLNALLAASNERGMALREFGLARAGARHRGERRDADHAFGLARDAGLGGALRGGCIVSRSAAAQG